MKRVLVAIAFIICAVSISTAQNRLDSIAYRAMQVGRVMQQERVFLHFDNSAYYLGETMWFKAFVTSHSDDRATNHSRVLYVELVSPEGYVVKTEKYKISDDGTCHGDIYLDPAYLSGYYEIRAYTRYMLNWGDDAVFSRVFPVYDVVKNGDWQILNMLERPRRFVNKGRWHYEKEIECSLTFYPEGGHLVAGLESVVAYELLSLDGIPDTEEITVLADGKPLLTTTPQHQGKGTFTLTPQKDVEYRATVSVKNKKGKEKKYKFELPAVEDHGVVLSVSGSSDTIRFAINDNYTTATDLGFAVLHRSNMGFYRRLGNGTTAIELPSDTLPEGVCRAVVFSGETPLAERLFFVRHDSLQAGDRQTVKLRVTANGDAPHNLKLQPHERVTLTVEREDGKSLNSNSNYAVAVVDQAGVQTTSWGYNLYTYQLLGSELKGYIPDAWQYFDPENKERDSHLDLIMLTHGWTAYDWSKLTATDLSSVVPAEKGLYIRGMFLRRIKSDKIGKLGTIFVTPQPDNKIRMDYSLNGKVMTTAFRTDKIGRFTIEVDEFYGKQIIAFSPDTRLVPGENLSYAFSLDRYFSPPPRFFHYYEKNVYVHQKPLEGYGEHSRTAVNNFDYLLSDLEVNAGRKKHFHASPNSELHLDYVNEWEYANDVTYLLTDIYNVDDINTLYLELERAEATNMVFMCPDELDEDSLFRLYGKRRSPRRSGGNQYKGTLSAAAVLKSALTRHGLYGGWTQPVVIKGEYKKDSLPVVDKMYLSGISVEKMVNFKEIVITSDREKCSVENSYNTQPYFDNGYVPNESYKQQRLLYKNRYSYFYEGFLSEDGVTAFFIPGWDNDETVTTFERMNAVRRANDELGFCRNDHPDHLACFVPFNAADSISGIIPDFSNTSSAQRYTSLQGYSESKQFYSPDYSRMKPDDKDYRRTLFWNPQVNSTDGKIEVEFYNNKECESFIVDVVGVWDNTIFSNNVTETREYAQSLENKKQVPVVAEYSRRTVCDSALMARCNTDFEKAEEFYKKQRYSKCINTYIELVQYNYPPALYRIGCCYKNGFVLNKDYFHALEFLKQAADSCYAPAQYEYAMMLLNGEGTEASPATAVHWLEKAAEQEHVDAQTELAKCYLYGNGAPFDLAVADSLLRKASIAGHPEALYLYALRMQRKEIRNDNILGNIIDCVSRSADKGHADALDYMIQYCSSIGDDENMYRNALKLHQQGDKRGTKALADCYLNGIGVKRDKSLAKDLYREAGE